MKHHLSEKPQSMARATCLFAGLLFVFFMAMISPSWAGCGSSFAEVAIPDNPLNYPFEGACNKHEDCYNSCGKSREQCDLDFRDDLRNVCARIRSLYESAVSAASDYNDRANAQPIYRVDLITYYRGMAAGAAVNAARRYVQSRTCATLAGTYYTAMKTSGRGAYCTAQKRRHCCPVQRECDTVYRCDEPAENTQTPPAVSLPGTTVAPTSTTTSAVPSGPTGHVMIGTDSTEWCKFRPGSPTSVPLGGGGISIPTGPGSTPGGTGTPITPGGPYVTPGIPGSTPGGTPINPGTPTITSNPVGSTPGAPVVTPGVPATTPRNGDDPKDKPTDNDDPRDAPTQIYINVKASSTAIQAGQTAVQLPGQQIKIFHPSTVNPRLPGGGAPKDVATGHDADPVQGTTGGAENSKTLKVPSSFFGANPPPANAYNIGINIDPNQTSVIAQTAVAPLVEGQKPIKVIKIGDAVFNVYAPSAATAAKLTSLTGGQKFEINICLIKEPVAPGREFKPVDAREALPHAQIKRSDLFGKRSAP